jgi:hypothetical protein
MSAQQKAKKQKSASFVLIESGNNTVIGQYSLMTSSILLYDLPEKTTKKRPVYTTLPDCRLSRFHPVTSVPGTISVRGWRVSVGLI